jgi:hypothetical protein
MTFVYAEVAKVIHLVCSSSSFLDKLRIVSAGPSLAVRGARGIFGERACTTSRTPEEPSQ